MGQLCKTRDRDPTEHTDSAWCFALHSPQCCGASLLSAGVRTSQSQLPVQCVSFHSDCAWSWLPCERGELLTILRDNAQLLALNVALCQTLKYVVHVVPLEIVKEHGDKAVVLFLLSDT